MLSDPRCIFLHPLVRPKGVVGVTTKVGIKMDTHRPIMPTANVLTDSPNQAPARWKRLGTVATAAGPSAILRAAVTATASHNQPMRLTATNDRGEVEASELGLSLN